MLFGRYVSEVYEDPLESVEFTGFESPYGPLDWSGVVVSEELVSGDVELLAPYEWVKPVDEFNRMLDE